MRDALDRAQAFDASGVRHLLRDMPERVGDQLAGVLPHASQSRQADTARGDVIVTVAPDELAQTLSLLRERVDGHLVDLFADASSPASSTDGLSVHVILSIAWLPAWLHLVVPLDARTPQLHSLISIIPATDWYERELWDEAGVAIVGHPALTRLRLPPDWPQDVFPIRGMPGNVLEVTSDGARATGAARLPLAHLDHERVTLDPGPEGIVDYPLGPVRSGIVESGHYTLRTVGEEIVDFHLQLFYKHRGVEQRAVGLTPLTLPLVAERISGTSGFAHALAVCQAVESAEGIQIPQRARFLRVLYAELERLYNHFGYQADVCQATGLVVGQAQYELLKERVLRLNAVLSGHRYLFGACVVGGVRADPSPDALDALRTLVRALQRKARRLGTMLLGSSSHVDRLSGTGILDPGVARAWEVVGPTARASGIDADVRRDHPYAAYDEVTFDVPVLQDGDAQARVAVRLEEIAQSLRIIEYALARLPAGPAQVAVPDRHPQATGLGWVESPRGEGLHWVRLSDAGTVTRYRVRTASFANAQAFPLCVPGRNILTDFPVIEQSWGLSYAGVDR